MPEQLPIRVTREGPRPAAPLAPTDSVWNLARLSLGMALLGTAWLARRTPGATSTSEDAPPPSNHTLRYAAVGLAGELERLSARASLGLDQTLRPRPIGGPPPRKARTLLRGGRVGRRSIRGGTEARGRFELARVEERGRQEVTRLISAGQEREEAARDLTGAVLRDALGDAVEEVVQLSVVRVAASPAVREVIHVESSGLMEDLLDALRSRLIRADDRAERGVRRLLHLGAASHPS